MTSRYKVAGGIGLGLAALATAGITYLQGLELWSDPPEPPRACKNVVVLVGYSPVSCPHAEHVERIEWDEKRSTAHLLCECYPQPDM